MSFFAVLLALLIEQIKPLPRVNRVGEALQAWVAWVVRTLDAGQRRHARIVWAVSVLVPTAVAALLYLLVRQLSRQVLADGDLRAVRDRLNQELDGQLPTQADTVLTPELRGKIKAQFSRCAAALEGLGNG